MFFFVHFLEKNYFSYFLRSQNYLYQLQTTVVFYHTERILLITLFVFRLSIMRHEMLNFLRNLHSYVATQVLEVSWLEFQVP
jgi:hypothetical protein